MESDRWYYLEAGRAVGPVSRGDLELRAESGLLGGDDLVWLEGMAGWERAANIDGLQTRPLLPIAPPPLRLRWQEARAWLIRSLRGEPGP
jgi:hypothetical protein